MSASISRIPLDLGSYAEVETTPGLRIIRLLRPWTDGSLRIAGEARCVGEVLDDMQVSGDAEVIRLAPMIVEKSAEMYRAATKLLEAAHALELRVTGKVGN